MFLRLKINEKVSIRTFNAHQSKAKTLVQMYLYLFSGLKEIKWKTYVLRSCNWKVCLSVSPYLSFCLSLSISTHNDCGRREKSYNSTQTTFFAEMPANAYKCQQNKSQFKLIKSGGLFNLPTKCGRESFKSIQTH